MKFSALLSLYYKEKAEYFHRCMVSVCKEQTQVPDEVVVVLDGKLTEELYDALAHWQKMLGDTLKCVVLQENQGLGYALDAGLKNCSYELVARMDTDDIAYKDRFAMQLHIFRENQIDLCGSWVDEFEDDEKTILACRKVPENHEQIAKFAKQRNPINHPSVMYRKSVVLQAGGYKEMRWFEDYFLWVRMLQHGSRFYNIQQPLVAMRAGDAQLERRGGLGYAKEELRFLKELYSIKFLSKIEFLQVALVRIPSRLLPRKLLRWVYGVVRGVG